MIYRLNYALPWSWVALISGKHATKSFLLFGRITDVTHRPPVCFRSYGFILRLARKQLMMARRWHHQTGAGQLLWGVCASHHVASQGATAEPAVPPQKAMTDSAPWCSRAYRRQKAACRLVSLAQARLGHATRPFGESLHPGQHPEPTRDSDQRLMGRYVQASPKLDAESEIDRRDVLAIVTFRSA